MKLSLFNGPKVVVKFISKQTMVFLTSKVFNERLLDFTFNIVDDIVDLAYDNSKKNKDRPSD